MLAHDSSAPSLAVPPPPALALDHVELVRAVASGVCRRGGGALDRDELMSAGLTGLAEAAQRYRPGGDATFATFAYYRVVGAMRDELRAARARVDAEPTDALEDPSPAADTVVLARETLTVLVRALAALPERERTLVERSYLDGVNLSVAAAELGLSTSRASRIRSRAVAALRAEVEAALGA